MTEPTGSSLDAVAIERCRAFHAGFTVMDTVHDVYDHFGGRNWLPRLEDPGDIVRDVDQMISMLDQGIRRARGIVELIEGFEGEKVDEGDSG
jgi:hypothetical protein